MRIICLEHVAFEGPGAIEDWAQARGHEFERVRLHQPDPTHPGEADLVIIMGGPMGVHDEDTYSWLAEEKHFIAAKIEQGAAVLGVCLGAQLLTDVLGGDVTHAPEPEIGWYPVTLNDDGRASGVLGRLPERFDALHWHGDTFSIPSGATRLASSAACPNQAYEYDSGRVVAVQFHLECTHDSLATLIDEASADLATVGPWVSSAEEMLARPEKFQDSRGLLFTMLDSMSANRLA